MQNYFIKLDGIEGESTSEQAAKQIELLSWSHSITMPMSSGHPSGVSVKHGRTDHADLTITKHLDKTSPTLNQFCSAGNNIKTAVLTIWQADGTSGKHVNHYMIELEDLIITSYSIGAGGSDLPVETVTLHYNKIKWTYATQGKDAPGGNKGKVVTGWDLEKNVKI